MSRVIFESSFVSLADEEYRVKLYGKSYVGLYAPIVSGLGNVFHLSGDWTDYLQNFQDVVFGTYQTPLTTAYKNRVIADGGTFENEECVIEFLGENIRVQSFDYDSGADVTLTTLNATYDGQTLVNNYTEGVNSYVPFFKPVIVDLVSQYSNSDDYILSPLMTSSTDITYANVQEDRTTVDTAFFDRFIELYLQSDDDELRLTIERNTQIDETLLNAYKNRVLADSGTFENETCLEEFLLDITEKVYQLEWAGNLVMDLIEWDNESSPRQYVFRVIDGIDRLKDVEYNGDVTDLQNRKLKDIILDVLELNGLDIFWSESDVYLKESIEYQAVEVIGANGSDSPIDYTYMYENLLMKKTETKDDRIFLTGYDILYGLMECFSTKLIHTNGHYYLQQVRNYDTTTIVNRDYVKSGTYIQGNYTHSNNSLRVLAGGKFGYAYGIKQARIESEHKDVINIGQLPPKAVHSVDMVVQAGQQSVKIEPPIEQNVGNIIGGFAQGQFINLQFDISGVVQRRFDGDLICRLHVFESDGNKFLKGSDTINPGWFNSAVVTERYYEKRLVIQGNGNVSTERVKMVTPLIPFDMDSVIVKLEILATNIRFFQGNNVPVFQLQNFILAVPINVDDLKQSIYVDNPNTKFTKDLELKNLMINEGNSAVQINNFSVDENYNGGALTFAIDSFWNGGFETNGNLSVLRVLEAVSLQYKPLRKYFGTFEGTYYPFQTIPYDGAVFACQSLQKNYLTDESNGTWFEVLISRVGLEGSVIDSGTASDPQEVIQGFRIARELDRGVGILDVDINPNIGITQITINSQGEIRKGDKIELISDTGDVLLTLTADQDLDNTGELSTLDVQSFDLFTPITSGAKIVYGYKKMYFSEKLRFDSLQHTDVKVAPTALGDLEDGEVIFVGRDIFVREGEVIYRHRASPYI